MMLDEFPALGRLDFFETALAFMAGYGIRAFLIAQTLNQIDKAYGENNAILDNCHVRVAFATNDERTAKRISDALGTATEQRAMRNYAGHRLAPWLAHVMVSRQETARPLLTPGRGDAAAAERRAGAGLGHCRRSARRSCAITRTAASPPRLLPPPALGGRHYADRPPQRVRTTGRAVRAESRRACRGAEDEARTRRGRPAAAASSRPCAGAEHRAALAITTVEAGVEPSLRSSAPMIDGRSDGSTEPLPASEGRA